MKHLREYVLKVQEDTRRTQAKETKLPFRSRFVREAKYAGRYFGLPLLATAAAGVILYTTDPFDCNGAVATAKGNVAFAQLVRDGAKESLEMQAKHNPLEQDELLVVGQAYARSEVMLDSAQVTLEFKQESRRSLYYAVLPVILLAAQCLLFAWDKMKASEKLLGGRAKGTSKQEVVQS